MPRAEKDRGCVRRKKPGKPMPGDKALWIRFSAFGDVLQAAASAQRFKMKYPDVRLTFLTQPEYADILRIQPYIDDLICWDVKRRPLNFLKTIWTIRAARFDWLFSLHRSGASALIAFFSRAFWRFGYNSVLQLCYHTTHWEFFDAFEIDAASRDTPAIFTTPEDREKARIILSDLPEKKIFAIIGASKPQKFWPVQHWIDFLTRLAAEGWGIVLNGHGETETRVAEDIEKALQSRGIEGRRIVNTVGRTPFPLMAAVAQACAAAAGNDTGPLHLAGLLGVPALGFFGVTNAYRAGYRMPWFHSVTVSCPNEGCWNYRCPICCLADISPEKALSAFRKLFE
jgi:heptosyltransferase-1/heptosyltransferase-2